MLGEQDQGVQDVLAVDLDDLELREEQLRQRERRARLGQAVAEVDAVAHLECIDEDIDRPTARDIDEIRLLLAEQRVLLPIRRVPLGLEELIDRRTILRCRREVEIDLGPPRPGRPARRVRANGHPAHQAQGEPARVGGLDQAE